MARYILRINDNERRDSGDESTDHEVMEDVEELLRSIHLEIDSFIREPES
jgi:hypothetical protein